MLQGAVSGSVQASDRLMKELREIYRSQSYKTGDYTDTFPYSGDYYCFLTSHQRIEVNLSVSVSLISQVFIQSN